jgi:hypothetical protein
MRIWLFGVIILVLLSACNPQENLELSEKEKQVVNEAILHASIYRNANPDYFVRNATLTEVTLPSRTGLKCHYSKILYPSYIQESSENTACPKPAATLTSVSPIGSLEKINLTQYNISNYNAEEYYSVLILHIFNDDQEASEYISNLQQLIRELHSKEVHFLEEYDNPAFFVRDRLYIEYDYHYLATFIHSVPEVSTTISYVNIAILRRNNEVLIHRVYSDKDRIIIRPHSM